MDHDQLAATIADPRYDGLDDAAVVEALRAHDPVVSYADLTTQSVFGYLATAGLIPRLKVLATGAPPSDDAGKAAWGAAVSLFAMQGVNPVFIASQKDHRDKLMAMFNALVAAGYAKSEDSDALLALATVTTPFLASIGCPELLVMDDSSAVDHIALAHGEDPQAKRQDPEEKLKQAARDKAAADAQLQAARL